MSLRLELPSTLTTHAVESTRPLVGLWACSGSEINTEILAGSGCDWILIDTEHSPNDLQSILTQLHVVSGYPVTPVVRSASSNPVTIKQILDLGVQNLLIPMIDSAEEATEVVNAVSYPNGTDGGIRGVGSALARSSRWNRVPQYLQNARRTISVTVQIESARAVENVEHILHVEGIDAIFIGPSDLSASMGHLGEPSHPNVVSAALHAIAAAKRIGKPVGVNAFNQLDAARYIDAGADFIAVGADVSILARQSEVLVAPFLLPTTDEEIRTGY